MRRALALLLAVTAAVEIAGLVLVARWLGLPAAVLLVLATSVLGVLALRREGMRAWRRFRQALDAGEPPGVRVADGLVGLVGGLLLVLPGFLTDVLGLLLLVPPTRQLARRGVQRTAEARMSSGLAGDVFGPRRVRIRRGRPRPAGPTEAPPAGSAAGQPVDGEVVEGEIVDPDGR